MADRADFEVVDLSKDFASGQKYGVQATPTFVILDESGNVVDTIVGSSSKSKLQSILDKAGAQ